MDKRNIVLITFDSLRADHCSFMGYSRKTTPTLDRMARRGVYFKNAVASSIATAPSMFTIATGIYPSLESNDYNPVHWRKEISMTRTLAEKLHRNGYTTLAFSPNIAFSSYFGFSKGFQCFDDFSNHEKFRSHERFQKIGSNKFFRFFIYFWDILKLQGGATPWEDIYENIYHTIRTAKNPYFVWILLLDTHLPYIPPKSYRSCSMFDIIISNYLAYNGPFHRKLSGLVNVLNYGSSKICRAYDDCIRYADSFVKQLWKDLKDDDPIFIIHADHGEGFGEHGFFGHPPGYPVILYDEFIRVPLVLYNIDSIPHKVFDRQFPLRKLHNLILNFSENNYNFTDYEYAVTKVYDRNKLKISIRSCRWKYICGCGVTDELYDLSEDPMESNNLISEHPEVSNVFRKIAKLNSLSTAVSRIKGRL